MQNLRPKVFCIGFHKTGTTSLGHALAGLGYRVTGPNGVQDPQIAQHALDIALELVPQCDAFRDNPWPILFREIDARVPGAKFIHTPRPVDAWYASMASFFGPRSTPMRQWIYGADAGSPLGNEAIYKARYERHHDEVMRYFADRPNDFLVMDLAAGDGWDVLCRFLGHPVPAVAFPHANSQAAGARMPAMR